MDIIAKYVRALVDIEDTKKRIEREQANLERLKKDFDILVESILEGKTGGHYLYGDKLIAVDVKAKTIEIIPIKIIKS